MNPLSWSTSGDSLQRAIALAAVPAATWEGTAIQTGPAQALTAGLVRALRSSASLLGTHRVANAVREIRLVRLLIAVSETAPIVMVPPARSAVRFAASARMPVLPPVVPAPVISADVQRILLSCQQSTLTSCSANAKPTSAETSQLIAFFGFPKIVNGLFAHLMVAN